MKIDDYGLYLKYLGYDRFDALAYFNEERPLINVEKSNLIKGLALGKRYVLLLDNGFMVCCFQCRDGMIRVMDSPTTYLKDVRRMGLDEKTTILDVYNFAKEHNLTSLPSALI